MNRLVEKNMGHNAVKRLFTISLLWLVGCSWLGSVVAPGVPFNVYGYVKDEKGNPLVGASVTVKSPIDQSSATTNSQGMYAATLSVNGAGDTITVSASYGGRSGSNSGTVPSGSSSMQIDVTVPHLSSSITCSASPSSLAPGGSVTVSGSISPAHAATVTLTYKRPDSSTFTRTVSSNSGGSYSDTYLPDTLGSWNVKASWPGDDDHQGVESGWSSFTVAKLSTSISVLLSPSDIRPGEGITISGSITPSHTGVSVTLSWRSQAGSWQGLTTVTTDSAGAYSYSWTSTPTAYGSYDVKAQWSGDTDHDGAEGTSTLAVTKTPTTISINLNATSLAMGVFVAVTGSISPSHPGATVVVTYTRPDGTKLARSVTTGTGGDYLDVYAPDRTGAWKIQASWGGDSDHAGASSENLSLVVKNNPSNISLSLDKTSINVDETFTISGSILPQHPGVSVTILFTKPDGTNETRTVKTDSESHYSTSYSPGQAGSWSVMASWAGDQDHADASSPPSLIAVVRRTSRISISLSPPLAKKGDRVTISGGVEPQHAGVRIDIQRSADGGVSWQPLTSTSSNATGAYSCTWDLAQTGVYMVRASWEGDRDHSGATSSILTIVVGEISQSIDIPLPNGGFARVLVASNSSALSLSVSTRECRISINVTGPSGTTGILTMFIPTELLHGFNSTIVDILFTIDGREVTPQVASIVGGYLVTLTYSHSTHMISVYYVTYQLAVRVLDHEGKPVLSNAIVNITGPIERSAKVDESGVAVFAKAPAGNYTITAFEVGEGGTTTLDVSGPTSHDLHTSIGSLQAEHQELQKEYDGLKMLFMVYAGVSLVAIVALGFLLFRAKKPGRARQTR